MTFRSINSSNTKLHTSRSLVFRTTFNLEDYHVGRKCPEEAEMPRYQKKGSIVRICPEYIRVNNKEHFIEKVHQIQIRNILQSLRLVMFTNKEASNENPLSANLQILNHFTMISFFFQTAIFNHTDAWF